MSGNVLTPPEKSSQDNLLTSSSNRAMIVLWMLTMSFGAASFIWVGMAIRDDSFTSILNISVGIFLVLITISRIVRKELENGTKSKSGEEGV